MTISKVRGGLESYWVALLASAWITPGLAAATTALIYIASEQSAFSLRVGLASVVLPWLLLSWLLIPLTAVARANARVYQQLGTRLIQLRARLVAVDQKDQGKVAFLHADAQATIVEAALAGREACPLSKANLPVGGVTGTDRRGNLQWVFATGYLELWGRIHRAEEALITIEDEMTVLEGTLNDELRLGGSLVPDRLNLLALLFVAARGLHPDAARYLEALGSTEQRGAVATAARMAVSNGAHRRSSAASAQQGRELVDVAIAPIPPGGIEQANAGAGGSVRAALRVVRGAINDYRDARWDGLVRMRNQLLGMIALMGAILYAMVAFALAAGALPAALTAGSAFYLVGACVGLLSRLAAMAQSDQAVEDYHLAAVRLVARVLLSGLAALGGIYLARVLPMALGYLNLLSTPQDAAHILQPLPTLSEIFDLGGNSIGLILAAIFGLTPQLLFRRLNNLAESYIRDLKTSEAPEAATRV